MENTEQAVFDVEGVFNPDDYLYFYGQKLTEERTRKEVAFLKKALALHAPLNILDLACGYGRHANVLAQEGHNVTGIDLMPGFLARAAENAKHCQSRVNYVCQDMRMITFHEEFDRAMLLFTAFGYFDDADNLLVLNKIANALKGNGFFCFDIPNRDVQLQKQLPYHVTEINCDLMIDRVTFDSRTGRLFNHRILIRDGRRKDTPFSLRLYTVQEITTLLAQAGFVITQIYGDWDCHEFTSDSGKMIIIAQKSSP